MRKIMRNVAVAGAGLATYFLVFRPQHVRWGASEAEVQGPLPGDEIIPRPLFESTRAITIDAPPEAVYPWLVQLGYGRAGWYSYDELEALVGVGDFAQGGSSDRILPQFQALQVGDLVPVGPEELGWFVVEAMQPPDLLALRATINPFSGQAVNPAGYGGPLFDGSWTFTLRRANPHTTRLVVRMRATYAPLPMLTPFMLLLLEPLHFLMERRMLAGLKERAEAHAAQTA